MTREWTQPRHQTAREMLPNTDGGRLHSALNGALDEIERLADIEEAARMLVELTDRYAKTDTLRQRREVSGRLDTLRSML